MILSSKANEESLRKDATTHRKYLSIFISIWAKKNVSPDKLALRSDTINIIKTFA